MVSVGENAKQVNVKKAQRTIYSLAILLILSPETMKIGKYSKRTLFKDQTILLICFRSMSFGGVGEQIRFGAVF